MLYTRNESFKNRRAEVKIDLMIAHLSKFFIESLQVVEVWMLSPEQLKAG